MLEAEAGPLAAGEGGVAGVEDGVPEAADGVDDRDGPVAHGVELGETAGLEAAREEEEIGAGDEAAGEGRIEAEADRQVVGEGVAEPAKAILEGRVAVAEEDEAGAEA